MSLGFKSIFSLILLFLALWLGIKLLLPLFSPFLLGLGLALAAEPMVSLLHKRLHIPRPVSSGLGVSMAFCFLAILLLMFCAFLVRELKALGSALPTLENAAISGLVLAKGKLLEVVDKAPQSIQPLLRENTLALFSDGTTIFGKIAGWCLSLAGSLLSHIPDSALGLGTAAISGFMISAKLPKIRKWLWKRIPQEKLRAFLAAWKRVKCAVFGWLTAQCKLMGLTCCILLLGLMLLRIPKAPLWALAIAVVDAFPVLGTGTVLLPWAFLCFLQEDGGRAVGLLGLYVVISLTRSSLEPRLLGRHLGLDPLVTLMALYAGFKLWGLPGMILAPLLTVCVLQLLPQRSP